MPNCAGRCITGNLRDHREVFYTFNSQSGDVVTLQAIALAPGYMSDVVDVKITLEAPDATPLTKNDAAALRGELRHPTDSLIDDLVLPAAGVYTVVVTRVKSAESADFRFTRYEGWFQIDLLDFGLLLTVE